MWYEVNSPILQLIVGVGSFDLARLLASELVSLLFLSNLINSTHHSQMMTLLTPVAVMSSSDSTIISHTLNKVQIRSHHHCSSMTISST